MKLSIKNVPMYRKRDIFLLAILVIFIIGAILFVRFTQKLELQQQGKEGVQTVSQREVVVVNPEVLPKPVLEKFKKYYSEKISPVDEVEIVDVIYAPVESKYRKDIIILCKKHVSEESLYDSSDRYLMIIDGKNLSFKFLECNPTWSGIEATDLDNDSVKEIFIHWFTGGDNPYNGGTTIYKFFNGKLYEIFSYFNIDDVKFVDLDNDGVKEIIKTGFILGPEDEDDSNEDHNDEEDQFNKYFNKPMLKSFIYGGYNMVFLIKEYYKLEKSSDGEPGSYCCYSEKVVENFSYTLEKFLEAMRDKNYNEAKKYVIGKVKKYIKFFNEIEQKNRQSYVKEHGEQPKDTEWLPYEIESIKKDAEDWNPYYTYVDISWQDYENSYSISFKLTGGNPCSNAANLIVKLTKINNKWFVKEIKKISG